MKKPIRSLLCAAVLMAAFASAPVLASPDAFHDYAANVSSQLAGATATYKFKFSNHFVDGSTTPLPGAQSRIVITFPAGYDVSGASFAAAASTMRDGSQDNIDWVYLDDPAAVPLASAGNAVWDVVNRTLTITGLSSNVIGANGSGVATGMQVVINGVKNPTTAGWQAVDVRFDRDLLNDGNWAQGAARTGASGSGVNILIPPGLVLGTDPAKVYAKEIIATTSAPVTLVNNAGVLNLRLPLSYNFSPGEVRHVRLQCDGVVFKAGTAVAYQGGGAGSIGAVNGLGTNAITFSVTASNSGVVAADFLSVDGNRDITSTAAPINCTYALYDFPSQAVAGGAAGRVVNKSGAYLAFAPSTTLASVGRTSTASVDANPAYTEFKPSAPTTATAAALSRLTYALASPAPLKALGTAISLADLHATGATGTRIVVTGDFVAAANANNSYTGAALNRVYLSTANSNCAAVGIAAANLSATEATFNVGNVGSDRMLCLAQRTGAVIPVAKYEASLKAVSAAPTTYAVGDLGPSAAGDIDRDGTELQAPLVQVPQGWLARIALTNTGTVARSYTIRTLDAANEDDGSAGKKLILNTITGTLPGNGTKVIRLNDDALDLATGGRRGTVIVTVDGPKGQIEGLYQVVNPNNGLVNNHIMTK